MTNVWIRTTLALVPLLLLLPLAAQANPPCGTMLTGMNILASIVVCPGSAYSMDNNATLNCAGNVRSALLWKKPGIHSTKWRTTSRAAQPSHGAGLSQAASGIDCTRCVNCPATLR